MHGNVRTLHLVALSSNRLLNFFGKNMFVCPQRAYALEGVCLGMEGGLPWEEVCMEGVDPPDPRDGQRAVGTYPTGMHFYCNYLSRLYLLLE